MYTVWKRTVPPPSLTTFDAPDREKCTAGARVTNTPLQALTLLNDPTYVEAARALAQRALRTGGKSDRERIDFAFQLATARTPDPQERDVLLGSLLEFRSDLPPGPGAGNEAAVRRRIEAGFHTGPARSRGLDHRSQHDPQSRRNHYGRIAEREAKYVRFRFPDSTTWRRDDAPPVLPAQHRRNRHRHSGAGDAAHQRWLCS